MPSQHRVDVGDELPRAIEPAAMRAEGKPSNRKAGTNYEKKFAMDQEKQFNAAAWRNKLLGKWAAAKLGLSGAAATDYVNAVVKADLAHTGHGAHERVRRDFRKLTRGEWPIGTIKPLKLIDLPNSLRGANAIVPPCKVTSLGDRAVCAATRPRGIAVRGRSQPPSLRLSRSSRSRNSPCGFAGHVLD
jgi:hypothetical protein